MTPIIEKQICQIKEVLKDNPADANAYVLLRTMVELLQPVRDKLAGSTEVIGVMVSKQIKLIIDVAISIIEFLDIKKANIK